MHKCIFTNQDLKEGEIYSDGKACQQERQKVLDYLEKEDRITVGMSTCGQSAGARATYEALKNADLGMPVDSVGCSGMCHNEPIVTVRQDGQYSIYGHVTKDHVENFIQAIQHKARHEDCFIASSLDEIDYFKKQKRILMRRCGANNPTDLKQYIATGGFEGLKKALQMEPNEVIELVKESGLRGRGGAGFPTGMKWSFLAGSKGKRYLIVNADEGDPGAFMNRTLMESDPYQILEGLIIAAYATESKDGIIYTRAEYPLAVETLQKAIDILKENGFLGDNILSKEGFNFEVKIMMGAGAFVCGEETALMKSIEGERGHPRPRPPFPAAKGVWGHPSNINNVESYAHVGNILAMGKENYQAIGSEKNSGTKCICLTGKVKKTGVVEIPLGISLRELIFDIGGGIKKDKSFKAVQAGGPSGGCIVESELDTPLDYDHIPQLGAIMGSGGLVIMDENDCMVHTAKFFLNFTTEESCGKCVPCREGTKRMHEMLESISRGVADIKVIDELDNLAAVIKDSALCGLGQTAPNPVLSTIKKFREEYEMHIKEKKCPCGVCEALLTYMITDKCVGCGNCERNCPVGAISGKLKEKFTIDQEKCIKCGKCYKVCAFGAIEKK